MSDDADEKGFMDKVKEKAGEIQTAMGPAMESAQKRMSEWGSKVQEKYEEFKADMAPKVARGRKSVVAMTESVKVNVIDPTAEWGSKVKAEWQEPYDGKVALAGCCCISLLDLTYPTCIGLRFKGLCVCLNGECTLCMMQTPDAEKPLRVAEFDLQGMKPPYFVKDDDGVRAGSLCKSVCHCCCLEERFAFPPDDEVPPLCNLCFIVSSAKHAHDCMHRTHDHNRTRCFILSRVFISLSRSSPSSSSTQTPELHRGPSRGLRRQGPQIRDEDEIDDGAAYLPDNA